jgi:hypothetical protein
VIHIILPARVVTFIHRRTAREGKGKGRKGNGRKGKEREGKGRKGKAEEGKGRQMKGRKEIKKQKCKKNFFYLFKKMVYTGNRTRDSPTQS